MWFSSKFAPHNRTNSERIRTCLSEYVKDDLDNPVKNGLRQGRSYRVQINNELRELH